ncbi:replication initiation and membrane attachment family protein [Lentibacillus saliphilus]|uniref:replication initiation and membrane attachment family protein n=1 Tax=Lentibacillus saliphilus TaxID=2737028 RepID=UPI001C30CC74|nr:DnaD domain protein [Lentibacillus saliphilus]
MNYIGKILPVDGYAVRLDASMPIDYTMSLTHLYQPLIGINAIALYQTLLVDRQMQTKDTPHTHHTLMSYLNMPLDDIYKARLKLEGIGLLKTYKVKRAENVYMYVLQPPFSPADFFKDAMLSQLLYHHLGRDRFSVLKQQVGSHQTVQEGENITASFHDVFQTFEPGNDAIDSLPSIDAVDSSPPVDKIDFTWMSHMLKQRMIPVKHVLTTQNKQLITQMLALYDLPQHDVEKALLWALTEDNQIDQEEFKSACHDLFKATYAEKAIKLTEKPAQPKPSENHQQLKRAETKESQLIQRLEIMSPKQLLEDLSSGQQASEQDMKIIREVMTTQGLPSPVMNVLIHYVLLQSNMKLSKNYLEKIASHWSRAKLTTAEEAMAFAKQELKKFGQQSNKRPSYRKTYNQEVIPDWFKARQQKKQQQVNQENAAHVHENDEEKKEELAEMLRAFSQSSKK